MKTYTITEKEIELIREEMSRILRNIEKVVQDNVFEGKCRTRVRVIANSATNIDNLMKRI